MDRDNPGFLGHTNGFLGLVGLEESLQWLILIIIPLQLGSIIPHYLVSFGSNNFSIHINSSRPAGTVDVLIYKPQKKSRGGGLAQKDGLRGGEAPGPYGKHHLAMPGCVLSGWCQRGCFNMSWWGSLKVNSFFFRLLVNRLLQFLYLSIFYRTQNDLRTWLRIGVRNDGSIHDLYLKVVDQN